MSTSLSQSPFLLPREGAAELDAFAAKLEIAPFDLLLIGDGAGGVYSQPAGWSCIAYDHRKQHVLLHAGGISGGTTGFAELIPFVHALYFHHQDHGQKPDIPVKVQIVSDSEVIVRCGMGEYSRQANLCWWSALEWFEDRGYFLTWQHERRNSNAWNQWADAVAEAASRAIDEMLRETVRSCYVDTSSRPLV